MSAAVSPATLGQLIHDDTAAVIGASARTGAAADAHALVADHQGRSATRAPGRGPM